MFNTLLKYLSGTLLAVALGAGAAHAQDIRQQSCDISGYISAIDSIKQYYGERGFSLLREASMTMESEYEMPIVLPMNQGTWYQFVFIGDPSSRLYEVRMYDYSEKEVVFKQHKWGDVDGNIINFDYVPKFTEMHMIKPVQVNKKKKKLCGYVMLFKRTAPAPEEKK